MIYNNGETVQFRLPPSLNSFHSQTSVCISTDIYCVFTHHLTQLTGYIILCNSVSWPFLILLLNISFVVYEGLMNFRFQILEFLYKFYTVTSTKTEYFFEKSVSFLGVLSFGHNAVQSGESKPTFMKNTSKFLTSIDKPSNKLGAACFMMDFCFAYCSTLNIGDIFSSETSSSLRNTCRYNSEDRTLHSFLCENLKSKQEQLDFNSVSVSICLSVYPPNSWKNNTDAADVQQQFTALQCWCWFWDPSGLMPKSVFVLRPYTFLKWDLLSYGRSGLSFWLGTTFCTVMYPHSHIFI
jgi:hypothetical protein